VASMVTQVDAMKISMAGAAKTGAI
jgi:hypothetical protein